MEKSIFTREHAVLVAALRDLRLRAGMTQVDLAAKLGRSQSFVTKAETGERRLDVVQLRQVCRILGTTLPLFIAEFEKRLADRKR